MFFGLHVRGPTTQFLWCVVFHTSFCFCVRSRAATTNSPSWTVQISSGKQNNNMPAVVQNDWSKIDAWKQGHCISNPNNALFYWKSLKITKHLQCLTPPQMGNLMTTGNVTNFALSKVDPNFEQVHHFIASTWDVVWAVFAYQIWIHVVYISRKRHWNRCFSVSSEEAMWTKSMEYTNWLLQEFCTHQPEKRRTWLTVTWSVITQQINNNTTRWFKVTFWSPSWRSLSLWKGHLTIPKRSLWITRYQFSFNFQFIKNLLGFHHPFGPAFQKILPLQLTPSNFHERFTSQRLTADCWSPKWLQHYWKLRSNHRPKSSENPSPNATPLTEKLPGKLKPIGVFGEWET